jgi:hypothetical protein
VHLLDEDDGDVAVTGPVDGEAGLGHPLGIPRHVVDRPEVLFDERRRQDVDDDQRRVTLDQAALNVVRIRHGALPARVGGSASR